MSEERLYILFEKYLSKVCSDEERIELSELILDTKNDAQLEELLVQAWNKVSGHSDMKPEKAEEIIRSILNAPEKKTGRVRHMWVRWAVAASVVGLLFFAGYFLVRSRESGVGSREPSVVSNSHDVKAPNVNKATITTSDGKTIYLDSVSNGQLAIQNNVSLTKTADGKIEYSQESGVPESGLGQARSQEIAYHTLNNPRGSKVIDITLADGSHVWLNAGSSITYPVAFVGDERKVLMTGEAYFEIAKKEVGASSQEPGVRGERIPFIVQKGDVSVEVLGTHFNVNAYDDEPNLKVTLLEGLVKVSRERGVRSQESGVVIKPGEQAVSMGNGKLKVENYVDVEQVIAWKNGFFQFNQEGIETIMRQISRWYDVDVSYPQGIPSTQYWGTISRNQSLTGVFRVLEATGAHFKTDGKKVIVLP